MPRNPFFHFIFAQLFNGKLVASLKENLCIHPLNWREQATFVVVKQDDILFRFVPAFLISRCLSGSRSKGLVTRLFHDSILTSSIFLSYFCFFSSFPFFFLFLSVFPFTLHIWLPPNEKPFKQSWTNIHKLWVNYSLVPS